MIFTSAFILHDGECVIFFKMGLFFNTNQKSVCDVIIQPTIVRALHISKATRQKVQRTLEQLS